MTKKASDDLSYPRLPTVVQGAGGPIVIKTRTTSKPVREKDSWGLYEEHSRKIEVDVTVTPRFQWSVLFHELTHAALSDAGLSNLLAEGLEEAICDAVATARLRERFG